MSAVVDGIVLLLAWVAIFGLLVVVPWAVVRVVVGLLEADVRSGVEEYRSPAPDRPETPTTTKLADDDSRPDEPEPDEPGPI